MPPARAGADAAENNIMAEIADCYGFILYFISIIFLFRFHLTNKTQSSTHGLRDGRSYKIGDRPSWRVTAGTVGTPPFAKQQSADYALTNNKKITNSNIIRNFAPEFWRETVCRKMQEKHCDTVLLSKYAKFQEGGRSICAFACCVCYRFLCQGIFTGVRYVL